ncbi:MAG TPA: LpqB family beta-propeller domain-containing protein [Jatrophihabitantaceae bacterium]|nr:LpqB family beta-propeller domain-containing protein [Jatrophihabitantaceae bacterium]
MIRRGLIGPLVGLMAAAAVTASCSGVPSSSSPQVIGSGVGAPTSGPQPSDTPQPGAEARKIVQGFLRANIGEPNDPRGAREFLTPDEQRKWSDRTVTILSGSVQDAQVSAATGSVPAMVTVTGTRIGTLGADGTYLPVPAASGGGGQAWSYSYALDVIDGQWRIKDALDGLVVYAADFAQTYKPVKLYFYDLAEQHLVPDLRYTAVTSPQAVASWQLAQLLDGPRSQLDSAVRTEWQNQSASVPPSVTVSAGPLVSVELPASSHLESDTKVRLATELMATLAQSQSQTVMQITDGGVVIDVPGIPQQFTTADISAATGLLGSPLPLPAFYIDGGRLLSANGKPVDGPIGAGTRYLTSVAVAARRSDDYYVAATTGTGSAQAFWIGRAGSGLRKAKVPIGPLTRPSWAPGLREAWVGDGPNLYRVDMSGNKVAVPTGLLGGRITAVRLSPEGSRVAMIVAEPGGTSQLWVGAVVRSGSVRVDSAQPVTPPSYTLTDVAWNDDVTLYVIGRDATHAYGIWAANVDGSITTGGASLQSRSRSGLPQAPDSIAAAPGVSQWVSAGGNVFELKSDWEGPNNHTTPGTKPVYLE